MNPKTYSRHDVLNRLNLFWGMFWGDMSCMFWDTLEARWRVCMGVVLWGMFWKYVEKFQEGKKIRETTRKAFENNKLLWWWFGRKGALLNLDFRIQSPVSGSRLEMLCRIRVWGQKCKVPTTRGQQITGCFILPYFALVVVLKRLEKGLSLIVVCCPFKFRPTKFVTNCPKTARKNRLKTSRKKPAWSSFRKNRHCN